MKLLVSSLAAAAAALVSVPASAVVVGGIDFGTDGLAFHIETATLAQSMVTNVGDLIEGYGKISTVNGADASSFCASGQCSLYYHYYNLTVTDLTSANVRSTGGVVDLYYSGAASINLSSQTSPQNLAFIASQTPWARLVGHTFADPIFNAVYGAGTQSINGYGSLTGKSLSATGQGMLDVSNTFGIAAVNNYLNGNAIDDNMGGMADVLFTYSTNNYVLNSHDVSAGLAAGCKNGTAKTGAWCFQGSSNIRGDVSLVPEPASYAMLGLGLLVVGGIARRKSA